MSDISPREAEVLELLGQHLTNAQIGARLFISVRTVESHVSSLLRRLGAADRRELAAMAERGADGVGVGVGVGVESSVDVPQPISSFVGRSELIGAIDRAVDSARVVTLTGPGGIGKTRIAVEVVRLHPGVRAWFVDLVRAEPATVVHMVATAVGAVERPDQTLLDVICDEVADRRGLLVLDNCEHVLDRAAEVAARVTAAAPGVTVLATSREPLGLAGELVVPITSLEVDGATPAAVALFRDRAVAAGAKADSLDDAIVRQICARLDGLPLAIELAAARCPSLGVDGVAAAVDDRLRLLVGARGTDPRHRSLRAVLDWSYDLLDDEEQTVLRRGSVFTAGFTPGEVSAVAGVEDGAALDVLGRLAAKSLLVRAVTGGVSLYRMLDTVHDYARGRLDLSGERDVVSAALLKWSADEAEFLEAETVRTGSVPESWERVEDHVRAALPWGAENDPITTHRLARLAARLTYGRRFFGEAQVWFDTAAELAPDPLSRAHDLFDAADSALALLRGPVGHVRYLAAADAAEAAGDDEFAAVALATAVNRVERMPAEFADLPTRVETLALLDRARRLQADPSVALSAHLAVASAWTSAEGRPTSTIDAAEAALDAARRANDPVLESDALDSFASALGDDGQLARAAHIYAERMDLADEMSPLDPRAGAELMDILHMACNGPLVLGDIAGALEGAAKAVAHPLSQGALHVLHRQLVIVLTLAGRFDEAVAHAATMQAAWEHAGRPPAGWMVTATTLAALSCGLTGDDEGRRRWSRMTDEIGAGGTCLPPFSTMRLALHQGRLDDAVTEFGEADDLLGVEPDGTWRVSANNYSGYVWPVLAEVWVLRGEPDVAARIDEVRRGCSEHLWCAPSMLRVDGVLRGDPELIVESAGGFAAVGAEFEEAATLALLAGPHSDAGRRWLDQASCELPAAAGSIR